VRDCRRAGLPRLRSDPSNCHVRPRQSRWPRSPWEAAEVPGRRAGQRRCSR